MKPCKPYHTELTNHEKSDHFTNTAQERLMRVAGEVVSETGMELRYGLMVLFTKVIG